MRDSTMFTLNQNFSELNTFVDDMRKSHRATILQLVTFENITFFSFEYSK